MFRLIHVNRASMSYHSTNDASGSGGSLNGASTLLVETHPRDYLALEVDGIPMRSLHAELTAILRSRLGAQHAAYLARPVLSVGSSIRWTTNLPAPVSEVHVLSDDLAASVRRRAAQIEADIQTLAERLIGEGLEAARFAAALRLVSRRPPGDWLFAAGGHPVLACWGHARPVERRPDRNEPANTLEAPIRVRSSNAVPIAATYEVPSGSAQPMSGSSPASGVSQTPPRPLWGGWMLAGVVSLAVLIAGYWVVTRVATQRAATAEQVRAGEARLAALQADGKQLAAELAHRRALLQCPAPSAPTGK